MGWYGVSVLRKLFFIFFLLSVSTLLFANDEAKNLKMRIIGALSHTVSEKSLPHVYFDDNSFFQFDTKEFGFIISHYCQDADIVFTKNASSLPKSCLDPKRHKVFTLSYRDYIHYEQNAIGAFFWQKGRPNIILNKELIEYYGLNIPPHYEKYVE